MPVKVGHASLDENRNAHGGKAGEQAGMPEEVLTRSWYKTDWHTVLRPIDDEVAEKMASAIAEK